MSCSRAVARSYSWILLPRGQRHCIVHKHWCRVRFELWLGRSQSVSTIIGTNPMTQCPNHWSAAYTVPSVQSALLLFQIILDLALRYGHISSLTYWLYLPCIVQGICIIWPGCCQSWFTSFRALVDYDPMCVDYTRHNEWSVWCFPSWQSQFELCSCHGWFCYNGSY